MTALRKRGDALRAGDTIKVWWRPGRDTIISLRPYRGRLVYLFTDGAQIAEFAILKCGMTIENGEDYETIS